MGGWWRHLRGKDLATIRGVLPLAADRFEEAMHFANSADKIEVRSVNIQKANWYVGAHLVATLAIADAARVDARNKGLSGKEVKRLPIAKEFSRVSAHRQAIEADPLEFSRAYREMRNLRAHHSVNLVLPEARVLLEDIGTEEAPPQRWFFRDLDLEPATKQDLLSREKREAINSWMHNKPVGEIASRMLCVLHWQLEESCKTITS